MHGFMEIRPVRYGPRIPLGGRTALRRRIGLLSVQTIGHGPALPGGSARIDASFNEREVARIASGVASALDAAAAAVTIRTTVISRKKPRPDRNS